VATGLNAYPVLRHVAKHSQFPPRRRVLPRDHHSFFIQQAVTAGSISQIHPDRRLLVRRLALDFRSANLFTAGLLFRALGASLGAYRIPSRRPAFYPICITAYPVATFQIRGLA
jgi:hypothetical protein